MTRIFSVSLAISFSALISVQTSTAEYNHTPVYMGAVGQYKPLELYPVAVAVHGELVYDLDLFHKEIQIRNLDGLLVSKFPIEDQWPRDVAVDVAGNVYTADANNHRIRKYSPTGQLLLEVGSQGTNPGQFTRPLAMALDGDGNVYVADKVTELSKFDANGVLVWNNMGVVEAEGDLDRPQGIARDSVGNLYVADSSRNRIAVFGPDGSYLRQIGPDGDGFSLIAPVAVEVDSAGFIYVLNRLQTEGTIGQDQVIKLTNAGAFVTSWGARGRAPGELWEPQGLALDSSGDVWVAGYQGHNIAHYDSTGNFLGEWNDHNIVPYEFAQTFGAVVAEGGNLYITDFWNQVVQVFDRYGDFLFMWGERGQGGGPYFNFPRFTTRNSAGEIYIDDDNHVRRFDSNGAFLALSDRIEFPGGMAIDDQANVWVTGRTEDAIRKYSPDLILQQVIDGSTIPSGFNRPHAMTRSPSNGLFYVTDTLNHRILRLTESGAYDLSWGGFGNAPGQFRAPVGITIDSQGLVYVSETWNKRIQVFTADGAYLAGWDVPGQPGKDVGRVFELTMDGDYFLYAPDNTPGQAEVHKYALVPNVTASGIPVYRPGQDMGFYIWSDDQSTWHLRWSSDGVLREFSGTITTTADISSISAVRMEIGDDLSQVSSARIDFAATESSDEDGIDLVVDDQGVITFDLRVDGFERSELVLVGSGAFQPSSLPLPLYAHIPAEINPIGMPTYVPAQNAGYFLWQDEEDGEWHVRWSGDSNSNFAYSGTISTTATLTNLRSFSFESNDSLTTTSPSALAFSAFAGAGQDGLDFFTAEGAEVTFDLLTNGNGNIADIHIGQSGASPTTMPFSLLSAAPTAPTISITAPTDGTTVSGNVQVLAEASDNQLIDKVTFAIDGVWAARDVTAPYSFTWNSTTHANGPVTVQAHAFDLASNKSTSTIVVTANNLDADGEAPTILITEPAASETVTGNVQVLAEAVDNRGVVKVTFAIDGVWVARDVTAPYSFNWNSASHANGTATVQATAFDLVGNRTTNTIFVTVDNP